MSLDERKKRLDYAFKRYFKDKPELYVESGGRLEIIGNHTDHNHGKCLVAGCSLSALAGIKINNSNKINVYSEGFPYFGVDVNDLKIKEQEYGLTQALLRGVTYKLKELGYQVGGFDACINTTIYSGAGVSSSAAIEVLFGKIISVLFNENKIDKLTLAQTAQFAENKYFNKPSGLLDQIGSSYGGIDYVDFFSTERPEIEHLSFDLPLHIVLVQSGGSHSSLTPLYKDILDGMKAVAKAFDKPYLALVSEEDFLAKKDSLNLPSSCLEKAEHFYAENKRVEIAKKALINKDSELFLKMINESGESSAKLLKNTMAYGVYEGSPQKAIDTAKKYLVDGAVRIHGGGFAGTVICFVRLENFEYFYDNMKKEYGNKNVVAVTIRKDGASIV